MSPRRSKDSNSSSEMASFGIDGGGNSGNGTSELAFCVVWSPLPPITFLLPFVGHLGITDSRGVASDFRGPYFVGDDGRMAFGPPTRALSMKQRVLVDLGVSSERWDECVRNANEVYRGRMHNICCDNCHSHVAYALNRMRAGAGGGSLPTTTASSSSSSYCGNGVAVQRWDMVKLAAIVFFRARFLSWWAVLYQFGPAAVLILIVVLSTKVA